MVVRDGKYRPNLVDSGGQVMDSKWSGIGTKIGLRTVSEGDHSMLHWNERSLTLLTYQGQPRMILIVLGSRGLIIIWGEIR
jgi:hypothetical protein